MKLYASLYRYYLKMLHLTDWILPNTELTLEKRQRQSVFVYGTVMNVLNILFTLGDMVGPSGRVFLIVNAVSGIVSFALFILYILRKVKLCFALTAVLLVVQAATTIENLICAFSPTPFHLNLIVANMLLSSVILMLAVLAYLRWVPTFVASVSLITFTACTLITGDEGLMRFWGVFIMTVIMVCVLGERVVRNYKRLEIENSDLKSDEKSLMMALRLNKQQVQAYVDLSMVRNPGAKDMEVFFDMAGDKVKRKLVSAVMDYLNEQNLKLEQVAAAFPELTPTEHSVCLLILQGKKLGEICTLLNKTNSNVCAHRGHIRKKLGLNTEDNLQKVLTERMKRQA